jgi:hypothetical protein
MTDLLGYVRRKITLNLWRKFQSESTEAEVITNNLGNVILDHFAIIDLPGPETGIPFLQQLFEAIGFVKQGEGYLADKQNEFRWMAEENADTQLAEQVSPQVVIADFHPHALSPRVRGLIEKYSHLAEKVSMDAILRLSAQARAGNRAAADELAHEVASHLHKPFLYGTVSREDAEAILRENELLGWVLLFGRQVNHFGLAMHLCTETPSLEAFNHFIESRLGLALNEVGGLKIKGGKEQGIEQSATLHGARVFELPGGSLQLPNKFLEFVWRHPKAGVRPQRWNEYFTGFVPANADRIVESLYVAESAATSETVASG